MKRIYVSGAMIAALALAGCKQPQPPPTPVPPAPTATGYGDVPPATASANVAAGVAQRFHVDMDVPAQWWTLFHSEELNALVTEAIAKNPDIASAQAALRAARESYVAQRSSAYPNAQGSFGVTRQQSPTFYAPPLNSNAYVYGIHTLSLDVAYTPDVFGNLRYQTLAAKAGVDIQRYQTEATYLTLTSNVALTAIQLASIRDQLATTHKIIEIDRKLIDLAKAQRTYAQAAGLDVLSQEAALAAIEQTVPPLEKQLGQTRDQLARLLGRTPNDAPPAAFDLVALHLPQDLPLSLPSKLIVQRPDIAAATATLVQAGDQVGVAYTNRLPNFSINAQTATQALSLIGLFGPGSLLSVLTAQVAATFYDHGTLKHREAAAIAQYDEAAADYQGAVLSGFQNVADSMVALTKDADGLRAAVSADAAATKSLRIVQYQLRYGSVSALAELNAEQTYQQAELAVVQAQAARFSDTVALFQALGGGWWNRAETTGS